MAARGLVDHPKQEEPPRTVATDQRLEGRQEAARRRRPRPREPGFPHLVRILPLIPGEHREGEQELVAGPPLQGGGEWRGADRLSQLRIRHLFGPHDTLRSVKAERAVEPESKPRPSWGALRSL